MFRFLDEHKKVIYIGNTEDIRDGSANHIIQRDHLPAECYDAVEKVEYIGYKSKAEAHFKKSLSISLYRPEFNITKFRASALPRYYDRDKWIELTLK